MAKVKSPLMSISATGALAKVLNFQAPARGGVARYNASPSKTKSQSQILRQEKYKKICADWHTLDFAEYDYWLMVANKTNVTAFNAYVSYKLLVNNATTSVLWDNGIAQWDAGTATWK